MELTRKLLAGSTTLADQRQVKVICSTGKPDRMGDVIVQSGIDLTAYRSNPVVLWGHSADVPIAKAIEIEVKDGKLQATVQFPPEGEDEDSDWVYGKIKAGIVNATSVGFIPLDYEPLDSKNPWDGFKFVKSELLEFSFVSVPANSGCLIVGRSLFNNVDIPLLPSVARENGVADGHREEEQNDPRVPKLVSALFKGDLEEAFRLAKTPRAVRQKYLAKIAADEVAHVEIVPSEMKADDEIKIIEEIGAPVEKSGRSISNANKALLQKAMDHHESATKCIKDVLGSNETDEDPDEGDGNSMVVLAIEPKMAAPAAEPDQRALRLAEVKALRASVSV